MKTFTIGFTKKTAEKFFLLLRENHVKQIIDVRLNNVSQLSGFAKKLDLEYFLKELCDANYYHIDELAPTKEILDAYKKKNISWESYQHKYLDLLSKRNVERTIEPSLIDQGCLLCSEHKPHYCHRRLVVEYLNQYWNEKFEVIHLV